MAVEPILETSEMEREQKRTAAWAMAAQQVALAPLPMLSVSPLNWVPIALNAIQESEADAANRAHQRELKERRQANEDEKPRRAAMRALHAFSLNQSTIQGQVVKINPA